MPEETMQKIAAEINFSETTFVSPIPKDDDGYRVRIYTPSQELAFAGHPILGTAHIIREHLATEYPAKILLDLMHEQIAVTFEPSNEDKEIVWFRAPSMTFGSVCEPQIIANALNLSPQDIATDWPIQVVSAGTSAMMVPLRSLDALQRSQLDLNTYAPLAAEGFPKLTYLFSQETHQPENDFCVRFFFDAHGVREDPATGNGAAFFGAYLLKHQFFPTADFTIRIEQGHAVRRPSLIMLRAQIIDENYAVDVGGFVVTTAKGELL